MYQLPTTVLDTLIQHILKETTAAWLQIEQATGRLKHKGGILSTFGLEKIQLDCIVQEQATFLEGILSIQECPLNIDSIQLDNNEYADLYLIEDTQKDQWIILIGRTEGSRWKGLAQQKTNELQLLQQKTAHLDTNKIDLSNLLGILTLEKNNDNSFKILEPTPGCFGSIYPETLENFNQLHPQEDFPFLDHFLNSLPESWEEQDNQRIKSGPWVEVNAQNEEYALEATALLWDKRKILLIERLDSTYNEHHHFLQQARENALIKKQLEEELIRQKELEKKLIEAKQVAEHANKAKSDFLSYMSHEFKTPLHAILGFSQLMVDSPDEPLTEDQAENIQYIQKSGEHLLKLIKQTLELSKIEAGAIELTIENIPPNTVIQDCLKMIQILADQHQISIHYSHDINTTIRADYTRLKQVILNLLSNAVKYNKPNGSIVIEEQITENNHFRLSIQDMGQGIPEDQQKLLFTTFSRLGQENSNIEGTGLGLSVTKNIVEAMSGTIGFHSIENQGSLFWIEFPITKSSL